jgi:hypothetical protein
MLAGQAIQAQEAVPLQKDQGPGPIGGERVQCTLVDAKTPSDTQVVSSSMQDAWEWPIGEHIAAYVAVIRGQPSNRMFVPPAGSECHIVQIGKAK